VQVPKNRPNLRLKRPRSNSGMADASKELRSVTPSRSYGDPVLEWWRPGGSDLAIIDQGSQAYLSLPPSCVALATLKHSNKAHIRVRDSVRTNEMARKSARAEESVTSPELSKGDSGDGVRRRLWEPGAGRRRPGGSDPA